MSIRSIAGRVGRHPSSIYRWPYSGLIDVPTSVLRQKGKRQKPLETRELDTVVSGRGKTKACVATFVERKRRFCIALPITDRSASSMETAIQAVHGAFPVGAFRTATTDRGKEFSYHERILTSLGVSLYFADPYASR